MRDGKTWLVPLAGVVFFVLLLVSFAVGGEPPDADEPTREILDFYSDDKKLMLASALETLAAAFLVIFGAHLFSVLRRASGATGVAATLAFAGLAIVAVGLSIDAMINFALAETADDIDPAATQALVALWNNDFFPMALGTLLFLVGLAASVLRRGTLPAWIGWIAAILVLIALTPIGFVAAIGAAILVLIISILLTLRARSGPAAQPGGAPPVGAP